MLRFPCVISKFSPWNEKWMGNCLDNRWSASTVACTVECLQISRLHPMICWLSFFRSHRTLRCSLNHSDTIPPKIKVSRLSLPLSQAGVMRHHARNRVANKINPKQLPPNSYVARQQKKRKFWKTDKTSWRCYWDKLEVSRSRWES